MKDILINESFRVERKIGQGSFGLVYKGTDVQSGKEVAIKLERCRDRSEMLEHEAQVYEALAGAPGVARVWWSGYECEYYALVHDLLGPSLEDLLNYCDRRMSLKTVLLLADQLLARLQHIHTKFVHRDVKPDNILLGTGQEGNTVYIIDFGIAEDFRLLNYQGGAEGHWFAGTRRFASINSHKGIKQTRRDDLESLGYVLVYLARGSLPWQGLKARDEATRDERILQAKISVPVETLCEGLPKEFTTFIKYARSLGFDESPDYAYLRQLLRKRLVCEGFTDDNVFDWTVKLYTESYGVASRASSEESYRREANADMVHDKLSRQCQILRTT